MQKGQACAVHSWRCPRNTPRRDYDVHLCSYITEPRDKLSSLSMLFPPCVRFTTHSTAPQVLRWQTWTVLLQQALTEGFTEASQGFRPFWHSENRFSCTITRARGVPEQWGRHQANAVVTQECTSQQIEAAPMGNVFRIQAGGMKRMKNVTC